MTAKKKVEVTGEVAKETKLTVRQPSQMPTDLSTLFRGNEEQKEARQIILETAVKELFSAERNMKLKTRLSDEEVMAFAAGMVFETTYKCKSIKLLLDNLMELKVSSNGMGRKEFVDIVKYSSQTYQGQEPTPEKSWIRRLLRR